MLICRNKNTGKRVSFDDDQPELRELSNLGQLVCPDCKGILVYKSGKIKIPHFAHRTECLNPNPYAEHETKEHLEGKRILKELLERLFPEAEVLLEYKLEVTKQRADVMVIKSDGTNLAFEFQCSKISGEQWLERHDLYKQAGIKDYWVLGESLCKTNGNKINKNDLILSIYYHEDFLSGCFLDTKENLFRLIYEGKEEGNYLREIKIEFILTSRIILKDDRLSFPNFEKRLIEKGAIINGIRIDKKQLLIKKERTKLEKERVKLLDNKINIINLTQEVFMLKTIPCKQCNESANLEKGRMLIRKGKFGVFLGCSNFPLCRFTERICNTANQLVTSSLKCSRCPGWMELTTIDKVPLFKCLKCGFQNRVYQDINNEEDIKNLLLQIGNRKRENLLKYFTEGI